MKKSLLEWDKLFKQAFRCFTKPEDKLHLQISQHLRFDYPDLLWWHTQNEAKRTPIARLRAMCFGVEPGVADIFIPIHKNIYKKLQELPENWSSGSFHIYHGFFCELKAEYPTSVQRKAGPKTVMIKNTETPDQKSVREQLEGLGYYCCVCYTLDEFKKEWTAYDRI